MGLSSFYFEHVRKVSHKKPGFSFSGGKSGYNSCRGREKAMRRLLALTIVSLIMLPAAAQTGGMRFGGGGGARFGGGGFSGSSVMHFGGGHRGGPNIIYFSNGQWVGRGITRFENGQWRGPHVVHFENGQFVGRDAVSFKGAGGSGSIAGSRVTELKPEVLVPGPNGIYATLLSPVEVIPAAPLK
jgi:hypothetical protein